MPRRFTLLAATLAVLALAPFARAHGGAIIEAAAEQLQQDPVVVHRDAELGISDAEARELRSRIAEAGGGIYVAVLPAAAAHETGSPESALTALARNTRRDGTYAAVIGGSFRAVSNGPERDAVPDIASEAFRENRNEGVGATLLAFVDGVAAEREGGAGGGDDGGIGGEWILPVLVAAGGGALGIRYLRRRRQRGAELREVREAAQEDLIALSEDIRALDLDVELPGANAEGKEDYARALAAYERADAALDRARTPEDLEPVSSAIEEGRFAIASAKARLAGEEPPERRPPCFFDPRHGPSVRDVEWAPPGGEPRPVPACAADAIRIEEGVEPDSRLVTAGGERVPYWAAPGPFQPYAGGFFGGVAGGLLPGLLIGSMLAPPIALGAPGDAYGGGGDGFGDGDAGGGDFGDFGGGDFGGDDFGGGDFGGGGGDF